MTEPNVTAEAYDRAAADPVAFWAEAASRLDWTTPWHTAHTWSPPAPRDEPTDLSVPEAAWFVGGRLNVAANCVDRHVDAGRGAKVALHWEGENGDRTTVTYADLRRRVAQAAHALTALGVGPGDRVVVYLPVLVETVVVALACARIGAVHSLVFGGFSAEALRFRLADTGAKLLVTTDGQFRRGVATPVKANADEAVAGLDHVEHVLVIRRTGSDVAWTDRDVWWHDAVDTAPEVHEAPSFDAEHPLFIIYTSGTTGKPKGLVHTSGGYLTHASWAHWAHFDAKPDDVHWCTADLAWVTAHTYEIYGPLSNGLTQVIYEGTPDTPSRERHLEIIERYGVTVYYTAPTLIRTFMTWFGDTLPEHDLSSLRILGTVGEAINPAAWEWFRATFGRGELPVIDTWWQSETGAAMVAPLPGVTPLVPGSATRALPGIEVAVVDDDGRRLGPGEPGILVVTRPWPGMARTVWRDPGRYLDSYWRRFAGHGPAGAYYVAGDGALLDEHGNVHLLGRLDDVVNVSGHRLSTIEIESALVAHPTVGEAGVAGVPDPVTGQAVAAFVVASGVGVGWAGATSPQEADAAVAELRSQVAREIGPVAKPRYVVAVPELPKTRSGKIMRRLLAQLWQGEELGDVTSLQNPWAVDDIRAVLAEGVAERKAGR
ncbi:acetate--CoA ligase [Promicromonospora sukumoe]|uniref:Acetate--CoA ligase n=1 Tax=Promicromonospora sukumoe TaxID=88382 RepID=A0A7W3PGF3_9MICO|nr:acetate--CoA ligase [Promicromonospora sukumoe]MBA8810731.1 acetyl-CoA synthetase [Promicromonospora sukumoe]